jgi:TatD DNase family protein
LVTYLDSMEATRETIPVNDAVLCQAMAEFCSVLRAPVPEDLSLKPSGNGITALLHWRALIVLMSTLEKHQEESLKQQFALSPEELLLLPQPPRAFDSHCHLDRTMRELGIKVQTLEAICGDLPIDEAYEVHLAGVVGIFCDPETHPSREQLQNWISQGVVPVIGLHPRRSITEQEFTKMKDLLAIPEVAGLGEVGIDHTEPPSTWAAQMERFDKVLGLLQQHHVLVIHCRSTRDVDVADEAVLTAMYLLMAHPSVRRDQLIHLHCYTGSWPTLQRWIKEFPHTYVGFTSLVAKDRLAPEQLEAVTQLPMDRLLIETDAPYFSMGNHRRSTPGMIGMATVRVAGVLGIPWKELLQVSTNNTERLYIKKMPPVCVEVK